MEGAHLDRSECSRDKDVIWSIYQTWLIVFKLFSRYCLSRCRYFAPHPFARSLCVTCPMAGSYQCRRMWLCLRLAVGVATDILVFRSRYCNTSSYRANIAAGRSHKLKIVPSKRANILNLTGHILQRILKLEDFERNPCCDLRRSSTRQNLIPNARFSWLLVGCATYPDGRTLHYRCILLLLKNSRSLHQCFQSYELLLGSCRCSVSSQVWVIFTVQRYFAPAEMPEYCDCL